MAGINKILAQDWAMGVNDFTLKEGIILNPNYFPENGEDEFWEGDLKLTYKIENDPMKNYLKLNGFLRPTSGEFVTREFKITGDDTYNVEKAGDILYVARSLSCPIQEVVSDSEFKVTASVADVLTRYDSRFTSNDLGGELICKITSSGDVYYKAFSITGENVSLRDIKDWETGEIGSAFEIATLAVGDLFELINAYDVLQEGLELTTGYPTLGYVIKHVESSGSWIKFNKYDKPNKSAIDKVLITYYPLSDFQPEYPYWSYMDRYGTYDVEENIDFPITTAQEEEIINNFKKYLEPLITFTLITKRPTILRRGQEIAFSASRYPTGIFKVIDNKIKTQTEKGGKDNLSIKTQTITFANYTDNWARMIGNLKTRNDIQKAKVAEYKKQKSFFSFKLKVTWGNLSASIEAPGIPQNLTIADYGANYITISWDLVSSASEYHVIISLNSDLSSSILESTAYDNDFTFESLSETTTYYMGVKSVNYAGESDYSTISETTKTTTEYLIYSSNESGQYQIYIIKPDGTGKTNITNDNTKEDRNPQYSKILDTFVFERKIGSYYQICKKDRVSGTVTQLTSASAHSYVPAISPDGTKISFVRGTKVYIINASDGSAIVDFTPSVYPLSTNRCNFNSTSDKVLVVETTFPNYQGNLYNMSGVKDSGSVLTPLGLQFPAYSKDYTKLIMRTSVAGSNHIYKANSDGSNLTQMTTTGTAKQQCAYSPDGLSFAYIENYTGAIKKALVSTPDTATQIVSSTYSNDFGDWGTIIL